MPKRTQQEMSLGKISIGRLRVKMIGRPDDDGDVKIAATIPVDNHTGNLLGVDLYFQGLDEDGFEILTMHLDGIVPGGALAHTVSGSDGWVDAKIYRLVAAWQLTGFRASET